MFTNLRQKIILSLAFAALVYLALTLYADAPKLAEALARWDWQWLPLTLIAVIVNYGVRFLRWLITCASSASPTCRRVRVY